MNKPISAEERIIAAQNRGNRCYVTPRGSTFEWETVPPHIISRLMEEHAEAAVKSEREQTIRDLGRAFDLIEKQEATIDRLINSLSSSLTLVDKLINERTAPTISIPTIWPGDGQLGINPYIHWDSEIGKGWQFGSITNNHPKAEE